MSANDPKRTICAGMLLGGRCLLVVPGRAQDSIRFQIALEARQSEWPAAADLFEHFAFRRKAVLGPTQFDLVLLLLDFQLHARRLLGVETVVLRMKGIGQPAGRI